jgi:penicillin amidase
MQRDTISLEAVALLPKLLASLARSTPQDARMTEAAGLLSHWDGAMAAARPEPLIFAAWIYEIEQVLAKNAVGEAEAYLVSGWRFDLINHALDGGSQRRFCGGTADAAACDKLMSDALALALSRIAADQGRRMKFWRWGLAHPAVMESRPFGSVPVIGRFFARRIPSEGGADTINRGLTRFDGPEPFANLHGAGYRAIYDLAPHGNSVFMISTGQSGNPLSHHYDDLLPLWARGDYIPMLTERTAIEARTPETLTLRPAKPATGP